jgi:hypothetical protein
VLWLVDAPTAVEQRPASLLGRLLAALALFPGFLPCVGWVFGVPAFLVNRRVRGWPNYASRLGLGLSIVLTIAIMVAAQLAQR